METVTSYKNDPAFKAAFLAEIGQHEQADALIKGTYGDMNGHFKGCAIGCAVFSLNTLQGKPAKEAAKGTMNHAKVAADLGWPIWLAYLEDSLFESLPDELSKTWPRRLAEAVPVGAVIDDTVLAKILVWSLTSEKFGVIHATDSAEAKAWISTIAEFITLDASGTATAEQLEASLAAAWAAWAARDARAAWDAWAAREARDARAARDAREAWAARDARAAWAAWAARDAWAAREARDARAARDAREAWDAWAARAAREARDARAARAARAAWAAREARAARDAREAWAAWAARAAETRDAFFPALSEYVLQVLSALPTGEA